MVRRLRRKWFRLRHPANAERYAVRLKGIRMVLPARYLDHFVFDRYEPLSSHMVTQYIRPGMHVVDVGAHIGWYSLLAARRVGENGIVDAFEPWAENVELLQLNVALNGLANVRVHQLAAGREVGSRAFNVTVASDSHGFFPHPLASTTDQIEVQVRPVDALVQPPVDLVKIDVEGGEIEVLEGMGNTLNASKDLSLLVEWNPSCQRSAGRHPLELPRLLRTLGFEKLTILHDRERRVLDWEEAAELAGRSDLPDIWYVNLWAERS